MRCPSCAGEVASGWVFCQSCGTRLSEAERAAPDPDAVRRAAGLLSPRQRRDFQAVWPVLVGWLHAHGESDPVLFVLTRGALLLVVGENALAVFDADANQLIAVDTLVGVRLSVVNSAPGRFGVLVHAPGPLTVFLPAADQESASDIVACTAAASPIG